MMRRKQETYFVRIVNSLQWGVINNISNWNHICKWTSNYCRQSCSKKCLEKCVNASYKKKGLYYPCLVTLIEQEIKQLTIKIITKGLLKATSAHTILTYHADKSWNSTYRISSHSWNEKWRYHHTCAKHQNVILKC